MKEITIEIGRLTKTGDIEHAQKKILKVQMMDHKSQVFRLMQL